LCVYCSQPTLRGTQIEFIEPLAGNDHGAKDLIDGVSDLALIVLEDMTHEARLLWIKLTRLMLAPSRQAIKLNVKGPILPVAYRSQVVRLPD